MQADELDVKISLVNIEKYVLKLLLVTNATVNISFVLIRYFR